MVRNNSSRLNNFNFFFENIGLILREQNYHLDNLHEILGVLENLFPLHFYIPDR